MKHVAMSIVFETPSGLLGERYECSCGAVSSAAECAGTPGGLAYRALFGHRRICAGISALHQSGEDRIEIESP